MDFFVLFWTLETLDAIFKNTYFISPFLKCISLNPEILKVIFRFFPINRFKNFVSLSFETQNWLLFINFCI